MAEYLGRTWTRRALQERVGRMDQLASICPLEGTDGPARGVRLLNVHTGGGLAFTVVADRALDITALSYRGLSLSWAAPPGTVHPAYYHAAGTDWLRSFGGGLLTTCGLDHFGSPSVDGGETFGLHGRVSNIPASQVHHETLWEGDDYLLTIRGKVRQTRVLGEHLVLERTITTRLGSSTVHLEDTVINVGFEPQPHMILYHCNLGFPLVSEAASLDVPAEWTEPRDADAQAGLAAWHRFSAPTDDPREQVFRHVVKPDADGWATLTVRNPALGLGLSLRYDVTTLPHLFQWKKLSRGSYVLGLEPANSSGIGGRAAARDAGDLPMLEAGERRSYRLSFEVSGETV